MLGKIKITVDGKTVEADNGKTILEVALESGIYIPHLCHHPDLKPTGDCGICIVDVNGMDEFPKSCITPAEDGMDILTKTEEIQRIRLEILDGFMLGHPPECMGCPQFLNCEFQSVRQFVGVGRFKGFSGPKPAMTFTDPTNPLFLHDPARCIKCGRCVRACNDLRGSGVLHFLGEGGDKRIGIPGNKTFAEAGCRFCTACVEVCPTGAMRDREEWIGKKSLRETLLPCAGSCPADIDVPRYVRLVHEKKYSEATAVIREKVPFPKILGHVCHHPCESSCRRGEINAPIAIRNLKRVAAEKDTLRLWEKNVVRKPSTHKRVAVVGAGPAGLTAAFYLVKAGHAVTVFDAMPEAGGMMRYGMPAYRLPRNVLDEEIEEIVRFGVTIQTDTKVESLEKLMSDEGYDAVLVAVGTHAGQKLPIAGNDLPGVLDGLAFLKAVNLGQAVSVGEKIVVLGGGNVAFDCARVALRLGAAAVTIACLERKDQMPAACDEIEEGEEEGITVQPMRTFTRILEADGRVAGVACLEVQSFEFDEDGHVDIDVIKGSEHVLDADMVIFAIGQRPEVPDAFGLELDERGRVEIDPYTMETNGEGIFAAGDAVMGTTSVIQAIATGRGTAQAVDRYLGGNGEIDEVLAPPQLPPVWLGADEKFAQSDRCSQYCIGVEERLSGFCCLTQTLNEEEATLESGRCLQCDLRLKMTPVKFWGEY